MTVWETYRKRLIPTQVVIFLTIGVLFFYNRWQAPNMPMGSLLVKLAIFLGALELASLAGAWWGTRLRRKVEENDQLPPLGR